MKLKKYDSKYKKRIKFLTEKESPQNNEKKFFFF